MDFYWRRSTRLREFYWHVLAFWLQSRVPIRSRNHYDCLGYIVDIRGVAESLFQEIRPIRFANFIGEDLYSRNLLIGVPGDLEHTAAKETAPRKPRFLGYNLEHDRDSL